MILNLKMIRACLSLGQLDRAIALMGDWIQHYVDGLSLLTMIPDNDEFSDDWANWLMQTWAVTKREQITHKWSAAVFTDRLAEAIVSNREAILYDEYELQTRQSGGVWSPYRYGKRIAKGTGAELSFPSALAVAVYDRYRQRAKECAFRLIPANLHAEMAWVPGWDGQNFDYLLIENSLRYQGCYGDLSSLVPDDGLKQLLKWVNISSRELREVLKRDRPEAGIAFDEKCARSRFSVRAHKGRPPLVRVEQLVTILENGYRLAVPVAHAEINLRALYRLDPTKPFRMSTRQGHIHIGLHDFLNGAGYLDAYPGELVVPAEECGFVWAGRYECSIDSVYMLNRSALQVTPMQDSVETGVRNNDTYSQFKPTRLKAA